MTQTEQEPAAHHHHGGRRVDAIAHIVGHPVQTFQIGAEATLLEVMELAAKQAGIALLPPAHQPFDRLHSMRDEQIGPIIEHLDQTLGDYLREPRHLPHFTIELARSILVNNRWDEALKEHMSPREILTLPRIHLDYQQFTLYRPESTEPLPLDTPIKLERGTDLEAQRDGKYGKG
jgi:hypothetical protein